MGGQAYEFWTTLAEEEVERIAKQLPCKGYIDSCKALLLNLVTQGLLVINFDEDQDDEEWGHALSAACCLQKVALLLKSEVIDHVITFVTANIQMADWKNKYASLMALGSITEGPERQSFQEVILNALPNLLNMFADPNSKVREAIGWVMARISEHHADIFADDNITKQYLQKILEGVKDKPRISNQCCSALEKAAISTESVSPDQDNAFTPYFQDIIQFLVPNAQREDCQGTGVELSQASYVALTAVVQSSSASSSQLIYQLMLEVLKTLESTLDTSVMGAIKANHLQDCLCGLL